MDLQVIRYPSAPDPAPKGIGCDIVLLREGSPTAKRCQAIGDVFVGDTGWSISCAKDRVVRDIKNEACRSGADTITVRRLSDWQSSCYQARAQLLVCNLEGSKP